MSLEAELRSSLVRGQVAALERKAMMIFKEKQVYAVIAEDVSKVINNHYSALDRMNFKDRDKMLLEKYSIQQKWQLTDELAFSIIGKLVTSLARRILVFWILQNRLM